MLRSIATAQLPEAEPKFGCQSDPPQQTREMYWLLTCRQNDPQIRVPKSYPIKVSHFEQTCRHEQDFNNYLELDAKEGTTSKSQSNAIRRRKWKILSAGVSSVGAHTLNILTKGLPQDGPNPVASLPYTILKCSGTRITPNPILIDWKAENPPRPPGELERDVLDLKSHKYNVLAQSTSKRLGLHHDLGGSAMLPAGKERELDLNLDDHNRFQIVEDSDRERVEGEDVATYYKRRSAGVWACLAALTVMLVVIIVYGYAILRQEDTQIEQIPGMTKSLSAIGQHVGNVERRLADSRADEQKLAARVQNIDAGPKAALDLTRQQTANLIARGQETFLKNLNQRASVFTAQVSQLVSERTADGIRLRQVEEDLAQARNELETTRADYTRQVAALREQQGETHRELATLTRSLPTRQMNFAIQKNQKAEVTPGVSFQLTKIDVRRQHFDGWIESSPGSQKIWIQNQGVRSPVVFYPGEIGKPFVVVVTSLDQKGALGYLLMPTSNGTPGQTDFISSTDRQARPRKEPLGSESSVAAQ